jgi:hypothetical protein
MLACVITEIIIFEYSFHVTILRTRDRRGRETETEDTGARDPAI